jgi:hypothetical protein
MATNLAVHFQCSFILKQPPKPYNLLESAQIAHSSHLAWAISAR